MPRLLRDLWPPKARLELHLQTSVSTRKITYFAIAKKADGSLVTTDLGSCLAGAGAEHPREGKKANESFATTSLLKRVAVEGRSPIRGIQMRLTYLRKIVALTIVVVVGRRMFADQ